jgi:hypothetical protein
MGVGYFEEAGLLKKRTEEKKNGLDSVISNLRILKSGKEA